MTSTLLTNVEFVKLWLFCHLTETCIKLTPLTSPNLGTVKLYVEEKTMSNIRWVARKAVLSVLSVMDRFCKTLNPISCRDAAPPVHWLPWGRIKTEGLVELSTKSGFITFPKHFFFTSMDSVRRSRKEFSWKPAKDLGKDNPLHHYTMADVTDESLLWWNYNVLKMDYWKLRSLEILDTCLCVFFTCFVL